MRLGAYPARATLGGHQVEIVSIFAGAREEWAAPGTDRDVLVSWHLDSASGGGPYAWWAAGHGDGLATAAAKRCSRLAARGIYVRPWAELNADWVDFGSMRDFPTAWVRVRDIFRLHAPDVRFVFNPTADTYPETTDVRTIWPGLEHVDLHGLDGYNWARPEYGGWRSFDDLFAQQYRRLQQCAPLPVWVCEVGCAERPLMGDKGTWYAEMADVLPTKFPKITALVAFDVRKEEDWRVSSSPQALAGFSSAVGRLTSTDPTATHPGPAYRTRAGAVAEPSD